MNMTPIAAAVQAQGRGGDTMLVHMTPGEVRGLQDLAKAYGGSLSINPQTGLPEAGFLSSILPTLAGFALNAFAPGLGTAVGSALGATGAAAGTLGTGLLVGGATGLLTGNLGKGLMAGLGAYGGAGLGQGLMGLGAQQAGSVAPALGVKGAATGAGSQAAMLAEQMKGFGTEGLSSLAEAAKGAVGATPTVPGAMDLTKAGFTAFKDAPMDFLKENKYAAMAAAAPIAYSLLEGDEDEKAAEAPRDNTQIAYPDTRLGAASEAEIAAQRQAAIDKYGMPYGLQGTSREMSYFPGFTYGQPITRTVADGGEVKMQEGGEAQYKYDFDPVTGTFKRIMPETPAQKIAAGKEAEGAGPGGFEAPMTTPTTGAGRAAVPGKGIDLSAIPGAIKGIATALIPGAGLINAIQGIPGGIQGLMGGTTGGNVSNTSVGLDGYGGGFDPEAGGTPGVGPSVGTGMGGMSAADAPSEGISVLAAGGVAQTTDAFKAGDMMKNGAYVFTADALSAAGNGSPSAGLEALNRALMAKGAPPAKMIKGKGDGMSDDIPTTIDGKVPARVARDEAYIPPEAVKIVGKKWLDSKMKQARAMAVPERKGKQQRQVNPDKVFS